MKQSQLDIVIGILLILWAVNKFTSILEPFCNQCARVQTAWVDADPNNVAGLGWVL